MSLNNIYKYKITEAQIYPLISRRTGALSLKTTLPSFPTYWYCHAGPRNHATATPPSKPPSCDYSSEINELHRVTVESTAKIQETYMTPVINSPWKKSHTLSNEKGQNKETSRTETKAK
jgi:hypothetical protein